MYVVGIDIGGTKAVGLLADGEGRVVAQARGRGANLQSAGELEVEKAIFTVLEEALAGRDEVPAAICVGIAGVDRPEDAEVVRAILRRIGFRSRALVVNDALVALAAGAGDAPGVVIVAGTGSIAYGRDAGGRAARAGGWGYLLGDEGGGFWIGRSALAAVVRQSDGRGPATRLTEMVLRDLGLATPMALIHAVYYRDVNRRVIAGLTRIVERAAADGDAVAAQILGRACGELAAAGASVIARLGMRGDAFPVVLAGGVFRSVPSIVPDVQARLLDAAPRCQVALLDVEPAVGAVHLALAVARGRAVVPTYV